MDTVYNSLMTMAPSKAPEHASNVKQDNVSEKGESFQELMQNQQNPVKQDSGVQDAETDVTADKPLNEGAQGMEVPNSDELETRMLWAAMAAAQIITPVSMNEGNLQNTAKAVVADITSQAAQQPAQVQTAQQPAEQLLADAASVQTAIKPVQTLNTENQTNMPELMQSGNQNAEASEDSLDVTVTAQKGFEAETPLFREVSAVPVQVGEAEAQQTKADVPVVDQLLNKLENAARDGQKLIELELEPRSLGKVHIEMLMQKDGTLQVLLRAEKPSTQILLERDAADLQGLLARSTQQDVRVETPQQQQNAHLNYDEQQNNGENRQQNNQHNRHANDGEDFLQQLRLGLLSDDVLAS